jgi:hypothetical protein
LFSWSSFGLREFSPGELIPAFTLSFGKFWPALQKILRILQATTDDTDKANTKAEG